ncbi:MAG: ABC transporter permease [Muribaculaceae bacterium]
MKSSFTSFIHKETLRILRDSRTMAIVLLIPVILMVLFGFAISTEVNNINVAAVVDRHSPFTRDMVNSLEHNQYTTFKGYITADDIDRVMRCGSADAVVVVRHNAARPQVELIMDGSRTNTVQSAAAYLQAIVSDAGGASVIVSHTLFNPQLRSAYNFVPGIMGMLFILICAMMTSVSIVREKETGSMEVLLVSPVRPLRIVLAKLVPYFFLSCIVLTIILVIAYGLLDLPLSWAVVHVVWVSLLYVVLSLGLGLMISTVTSRQVVALLVSAMLLMMPVIMLSGMLFPGDNMPAMLQWLSAIVPARWYIDAMRKLMIEQVPIANVLSNVLILTTMAVGIITVAVKKFNDKLS